MEFLNPLALYGFLALPLLIIPYLIRRKPRRIVFSSLILFTEMGARAAGRPWGRLRLPLIFFLQLLLLALLIFALSEPVFSVRPDRVAVVLDNSASMQAMENGQSRFKLAQEKARELLSDLGAAGKVDIYVTTPRLEKLRSAPVAATEAERIIAALEPYDIGDPPLDYDKVLNQLADQQKYDRVHLITDHPVSGQGEKLRALSVGTAKDNLAIASLQISRASLTNTQLSATAEVANYSTRDAKVRLVLSGGGAVLASRELAVAAGKSAVAFFESVPAKPYYEAEIATRDPLLIDNRKFAVPPARQGLRILGISPRPQALTSLRAIPGVSLNVVSPAEYQDSDKTDYDLEIFHFAAPAQLPQTPALFVLPPDNNLAALGNSLRQPAVSNWREPHPLTQYVNFSLLRPTYARPLSPRSAGEIIAECSAGPLIFATQRQDARYLVLGFDPFPYLGRDNLPMSVLTVNMLDWFLHNTAARSSGTSERLEFSAARQGELIVNPRADKVPLQAGATSFGGTFYQGIYQLHSGRDNQVFAVNLQDQNESDLQHPQAIEIHDAAGARQNISSFFAFWPYLLVAALLLVLVEWFIHPRAAPVFKAPAGSLSRHA